MVCASPPSGGALDLHDAATDPKVETEGGTLQHTPRTTDTAETFAATIAPGVEPDAVRAALAACVLTLLDAAATYLWVQHGVAVEANPLMHELIVSLGASAALALRTTVGIGLVAALVALVRRSRFARRALYAVAAVLGVVGVWHLQGLLFLLGG